MADKRMLWTLRGLDNGDGRSNYYSGVFGTASEIMDDINKRLILKQPFMYVDTDTENIFLIPYEVLCRYSWILTKMVPDKS